MSIKSLSAPVGTALDRFIARRQEEFPYATGELSQLLRDIALAAKIINREINRAGLVGVEGTAGGDNVQGEAQQKLDVVGHIRFIRALKYGGETYAIVSEEEAEPIFTDSTEAKYIVAIDPVDGSSNIDVNVSIGTIFAIYRRTTEPGSPPAAADLLQKGRAQVAAGYVLYGASTMLVYTTGHGVNGFTLEPSLGEFFLSHPQIRMPDACTYYSMNDSLYDEVGPAIQSFILQCRQKGASARYIGSLVTDFHRNLLKGGIYLYPPTRDRPSGKIRLLYECSPLAFIAEQAGGLASDGQQNILDILPEHIHQRATLYVGSPSLVKELEAKMAEA